MRHPITEKQKNYLKYLLPLRGKSLYYLQEIETRQQAWLAIRWLKEFGGDEEENPFRCVWFIIPTPPGSKAMW